LYTFNVLSVNTSKGLYYGTVYKENHITEKSFSVTLTRFGFEFKIMEKRRTNCYICGIQDCMHTVNGSCVKRLTGFYTTVLYTIC
jgi:hypothetical protein